MQNINFDDGYKRFMINNNPNRVLEFNPGDINILSRIESGITKIEVIANSGKNIELKADGTPFENIKEVVEAVNNVDKALRDEVDTMLNTNASDAIFGAQSPLCMVGGIQLWERVLITIIPAVKTEVLRQQKERAKQIEKYTKQVRK